MTQLTQQQVQSLFDYRDGFLYWKVKHERVKIGDKTKPSPNRGGYHRIGIKNKRYLTHRLIYLYHHGYIPKEIDHIDGNPSNNKIENLREVTHQQNLMNQKSQCGCSSIYKGVCWDKQTNKWIVHIKINGKQKHLGRFKSEINAAKAYNKAAIKFHEEYANLNEVE
jgi:hypothetical protein